MIQKWVGKVPDHDDFGDKIKDIFIDGKTCMGGAWAIMTPNTWKKYGIGVLGTGFGQKYKSQGESWIKIEG